MGQGLTDARRRAGRWAAAGLAVLAIGVAVPAASPAVSGPSASIACVHAVIGGHHKCIAAGQYCARRYERDYEKYGYTCNKRDRRGRYHLQHA
jgi:hypothetical protein